MWPWANSTKAVRCHTRNWWRIWKWSKADFRDPWLYQKRSCILTWMTPQVKISSGERVTWGCDPTEWLCKMLLLKWPCCSLFLPACLKWLYLPRSTVITWFRYSVLLEPWFKLSMCIQTVSYRTLVQFWSISDLFLSFLYHFWSIPGDFLLISIFTLICELVLKSRERSILCLFLVYTSAIWQFFFFRWFLGTSWRQERFGESKGPQQGSLQFLGHSWSKIRCRILETRQWNYPSNHLGKLRFSRTVDGRYWLSHP